MQNLILRKAEPSDCEFAYMVKKKTLKKYVDQVWGWDENEQRQLHQRRFNSQEFTIIQWSGIDIGIMAIVRKPGFLKLNQLFIRPQYQNKGIGKECMIRIINDASDSDRTVRLQVLKVNGQALSFFKKLGFTELGENETHILMQKHPE